jgi:hypothetical protein
MYFSFLLFNYWLNKKAPAFARAELLLIGLYNLIYTTITQPPLAKVEVVAIIKVIVVKRSHCPNICTKVKIVYFDLQIVNMFFYICIEDKVKDE